MLETPSKPTIRRLAWLFDVDGTLITTEGAAREAFASALRGLGPVDDLSGVPFAGRTDPLILADVLARHALTLDAAATNRFWREVERELASRLVPERGRVLPGVRALLDRLARERSHALGLLTGNRSSMARLKLEHYGLAGSFEFGAFGEMAADRDALARVAAGEALRRFGVPAEACVVVGDTEHDVRCARAAGARVVAVATGSVDRERLASTRPDLLLDTLDDADALIAWSRTLEAEWA